MDRQRLATVMTPVASWFAVASQSGKRRISFQEAAFGFMSSTHSQVGIAQRSHNNTTSVTRPLRYSLQDMNHRGGHDA